MLEPIELKQVRLAGPVVLSIGVFDGVHLGHQHLLAQVVSEARRLGAIPAALTFDPRPEEVLSHGVAGGYLTDLHERAALIGQLGIKVCAYLHFDAQLARTPAAEFMERVRRHLPLVQLWVGPDFALGSRREGNIARLTELGSSLGFSVHTVPPYELRGEVVSSTAIRRELARGDVVRASEMLGRCYSLTGPVITGDRRGRQLGFPTANLGYDPKRALPADGVYAAWVTLLEAERRKVSVADAASKRHPAVLSIGVRPTFGGGRRTIESFLLDFQGDLYGKRMTIHFVERLRPELKFAGPSELVTQMQLDVAAARRALARSACLPMPIFSS